jgi:hypothetical protein
MMDHVIWLTGMPRSGTTWISQIFASCPDVRVKFCPLFSYSFKNALDRSSTAGEWQEFFSMVYNTQDDYMDQQHLRGKGLVPEFDEKANPHTLLIKSNRFHDLTESILQKCPTVTFVSIVRHPCAAIHSWLRNPLEFPADQDPKQQWRSGSCRRTGPGEFWGFEDWKWVTTLHLRLVRQWPERFLIREYKNFVKSPIESTFELFDRLGLKMTYPTRDFFAATRSGHDDHPRSVFKNPHMLDDWRMSLDQGIAAEIYSELEGTELEVFLKD